MVTDYYDPKEPSKNVSPANIQLLRDHQMKKYDALRFKELTERIKKLERERHILVEKNNEQMAVMRQI